jgi:hypothetical protein
MAGVSIHIHYVCFVQSVMYSGREIIHFCIPYILALCLAFWILEESAPVNLSSRHVLRKVSPWCKSSYTEALKVPTRCFLHASTIKYYIATVGQQTLKRYKQCGRVVKWYKHYIDLWEQSHINLSMACSIVSYTSQSTRSWGGFWWVFLGFYKNSQVSVGD